MGTPKKPPEPKPAKRPLPAKSGHAAEPPIAAADLGPLQEKAIDALLTHATIKAAARAAGVGERTLRRWLKEDAAFLAAYRVARRAVVENAVGTLQAASARAVAALTKCLAAKDASPADRIRAATAILKLSAEGLERFDWETRLTELEKRLAATSPAR